MEKKCVTALMTHEELIISNAIESHINKHSLSPMTTKPVVFIHNAKERNLNVEDWNAYGRPHILVLQDKLPDIETDFDVFIDFGYGKIWVASHDTDHTVNSPSYKNTCIGSSPLILNEEDSKTIHVILDTGCSYYNAWHERYNSAIWNRQINIAVTK